MKILLAEDYDLLRDAITETLRLVGHTVTAVGDGKLLLEKLAEKPKRYDLVITDNEMPEVTGIEALAAIRKDRSAESLPVIVFTFHEDLAGEIRTLDGIFVDKARRPRGLLPVIDELAKQISNRKTLVSKTKPSRKRA